MDKMPMNKFHRRKLDVLKTRRDYLEGKVTVGGRPSQTFEKAELGALNWAIQCINMIYDINQDEPEAEMAVKEIDSDDAVAAFRARIIRPVDTKSERSE